MSLPDTTNDKSKLLGPGDPRAFEVINPKSDYPVVLVCEHAGRAIPSKLARLGMSRDALKLHIAWDIGAGGVTRNIARILGAPAVLQNYSRLVIDGNRPPGQPSSMPMISDRVAIPANENLSENERNQRINEIFTPFHNKVSDLLDCRPRRLVLAIHSFTPVLAGISRPWDIGFVFRGDKHTPKRLAAHIFKRHRELKIGMNEPYFVSDLSDWFVPKHGEQRDLAHSLIEIRNDHLRDKAGQLWWAEVLCCAIRQYLEEEQHDPDA